MSCLNILYGSLIASLALCASPVNGASGDDSPTGEGRFRLRSGDRFTGRIEGLRDGGSILDVRHPLVADIMSIETAALARFDASDIVACPPLCREWQVELANGDTLCGKEVDLSADGLDLETETVGRITIQRAWLRSITWGGPVLDGPGVPVDWTTFNLDSLQEAVDGGFSIPRQQAAISRTIPAMPSVFRLDMEISYTGKPDWSVRFYANDTGVHVPCYVLRRLDSRFEFLMQQGPGKFIRTGVFGVSGRSTSKGPTAEAVTMMFDRPRQTMRLFLNGEPIGTLTGIKPLDTFGNVVTLQIGKGMVGTELRDIQIVPLWVPPPEMTGTNAPAPGDDDRVWLADGQRLGGTVETMAGGSLRVRTATGDVAVAADNIRRIDFAAGTESVVRGQGGAVVALRDGSRINLGITAVGSGMVVGKSAVAGAVRLRMADVRWIDWEGDEVHADASATASFELRNGDVLRGEIEHLEPGGRIMRFRHPHIRDPVTVAVSNLSAYKIDSRVDEVESAWGVELGAGQEHIAGDDLRLDDTRLTMHSRYVGTLSVPRGAASVLSYKKANHVLLRGINKSGWQTSTEPAPTFSADGSGVTLPPGGFISRDLPAAPERLKIEVEAQIPKKESMVILEFAASSIGGWSANAYRLTLGETSTDLLRNDYTQVRRRLDDMKRDMKRRVLEGRLLEVQPLDAGGFTRWGSQIKRPWKPLADGSGTYRYTVLMDASQRTMRVYVDGLLLADWYDVMPIENPGRFFTILSPSRHLFPPHVRITDLLVAEWDGRLPEAEGAVTDTDALYLRNRDVATGRVVSIDSDIVRIATARLTFDISTARLNYLRLAGRGEPLKTWGVDAELTLFDGSLLWMQSSGMTLGNGMIAGESPHLGAVKMPVGAVRAIRWHEKKRTLRVIPALAPEAP